MNKSRLSDQKRPLTADAGVSNVGSDRRGKWSSTPQRPKARQLPTTGSLVNPSSAVQKCLPMAERQRVVKTGGEYLRKIVVTNSVLSQEVVRGSGVTLVHTLRISIRRQKREPVECPLFHLHLQRVVVCMAVVLVVEHGPKLRIGPARLDVSWAGGRIVVAYGRIQM